MSQESPTNKTEYTKMLDDLSQIVGKPRTVTNKEEIQRILRDLQERTGGDLQETIAALDEVSDVAMIVREDGIQVIGGKVEGNGHSDSPSLADIIAKVTKAMEAEVPLSARVSTEAMEASAGLFRHLAKPGDKPAEREEIAMVLKLGNTLNAARTQEGERFARLNNRLVKYDVDLDDIQETLDKFVKTRRHDVAQGLASELARLGAKVVAVCFDVKEDVKKHRREVKKRLDAETAAMSDI